MSLATQRRRQRRRRRNSVNAFGARASTHQYHHQIPLVGAWLMLDQSHTPAFNSCLITRLFQLHGAVRGGLPQKQFDPNNFAAASATVNSVAAKSLKTDYPDIAKADFNAELTGESCWTPVRIRNHIPLRQRGADRLTHCAHQRRADHAGVSPLMVLDAKLTAATPAT